MTWTISGHNCAVHEWSVAGAVIEAECLGDDCPTDGRGVLLVENLRNGGRRDWSTPGGVIDLGETSRDALEREVREETGLEVVSWSELLYHVRVEAPDWGWILQVEVHRAEAVGGQLSIGADPDGIVVDSRWSEDALCTELLAASPVWVAEPLLHWMTHRFEDCPTFNYSVSGASPDEIKVTRLDD